jgi:N-acetylneuraminic acid mutarotase
MSVQTEIKRSDVEPGYWCICAAPAHIRWKGLAGKIFLTRSDIDFDPIAPGVAAASSSTTTTESTTSSTTTYTITTTTSTTTTTTTTTTMTTLTSSTAPPRGWKLVQDIAPYKALHGSSLDTSTSKILVFGGFDNFLSITNDVWEYIPSLDRWTLLHDGSGNAPEARIGMGCLFDPVSRKLLVFGGSPGQNSTDTFFSLSDVYAFDAVSKQWGMFDVDLTNEPDASSQFGCFYRPSVHCLYILGGKTSFSIFRNLETIYELNLKKLTWRTITTTGYTGEPLFDFGCAYDSDRDEVLVVGGFRTWVGSSTRRCWKYNFATNSWTEVASFPIFYDASGLGSNKLKYFNGLYLNCGGAESTDIMEDDIIENGWLWYDVVTNSWLSPVVTNPPKLGKFHIAEYAVDRLMIVHGGYSQKSVTNKVYTSEVFQGITTSTTTTMSSSSSTASTVSTTASSTTATTSTEYVPVWYLGSSLGEPRAKHQSVVYNGKMYVVGGSGPSFDALRTVRIYNFSTDLWSLGVAMAKDRTDFSSGFVGSKFYVFGGTWDFENGSPATTYTFFDFTLNVWGSESLFRRGIGAFGSSAVVFNNRIYISGGWRAAQESDTSSTFVRFDPSTSAFLTLSPLPTTLFNHTTFVFNNKIYVFGGRKIYVGDWQLESDNPDLYVYDPVTNDWTVYANGGMQESSATAIVYNDLIYCLADDKLWIYNPSISRWYYGSRPSKELREHIAVNYNNKMYVFGGFESTHVSEGYSDSIYIYTYETPALISTTTTVTTTSGSSTTELVPEFVIESTGPPRYQHAAALVSWNYEEKDSLYLSSDLYIIGGMDALHRRTKDLFVYSLTTRSWTEAQSMRLERNYHSVACTPYNGEATSEHNGEIFVIGGLSSIGPIDWIEVFKVEEARWKTATISMPKALYGQVSLYIPDLNVMFIHGGIDNTGQPSSSTYFYDLNTNNWINLLSGPALAHHTIGLWGNNLWVFGGITGDKTLYLFDLEDFVWRSSSDELPKSFAYSAFAGNGEFPLFLHGGKHVDVSPEELNDKFYAARDSEPVGFYKNNLASLGLYNHTMHHISTSISVTEYLIYGGRKSDGVVSGTIYKARLVDSDFVEDI